MNISPPNLNAAPSGALRNRNDLPRCKAKHLSVNHLHHLVLTLVAPTFLQLAPAQSSLPIKDAEYCEGDYRHHLQGICTNGKDAIYWSFTTTMVKTDLDGRALETIEVANHHGDLCFYDGKVYVAVNLGRFNDPEGNADSWVYVYDAASLKLLSKHATPEVFHGAGGIGYREGRFYIVGGLPEGVEENYVYEYDTHFKFRLRHVIASGWTRLGIQTATWHEGSWWFGCYGSPKILLKTDLDFKMLGRYEFDGSLGLEGNGAGSLLVTKGPRTADKRCLGVILPAVPDDQSGLRTTSGNR